MGRQVDAMLMALEIVHQPLRQFEQSLTAEQSAPHVGEFFDASPEYARQRRLRLRRCGAGE